jgi:uncharacterized membrane protein
VDAKLTTVPGPPGPPGLQTNATPTALRSAWFSIRGRILCVYDPTSPVPTNGYFLMVPEEDVVESGWSSEKTVQTILSGGLMAPPDVRYFKAGPAAGPYPTAAPVTNDVPPRQREDGGSPAH